MLEDDSIFIIMEPSREALKSVDIYKLKVEIKGFRRR